MGCKSEVDISSCEAVDVGSYSLDYLQKGEKAAHEDRVSQEKAVPGWLCPVYAGSKFRSCWQIQF